MKIIRHKVTTLDYPIGTHIMDNLPKIKNMVNSFLSIHAIKKDLNKGVNLICRGSSGAIIATIFAMELNMVRTKIVHIKKDGESSHANTCGPIITGGLNVIVDDFITSGRTMREIYRVLKEYYPSLTIDAVCISGSFSELDFEPKYYFVSY